MNWEKLNVLGFYRVEMAIRQLRGMTWRPLLIKFDCGFGACVSR